MTLRPPHDCHDILGYAHSDSVLVRGIIPARACKKAVASAGMVGNNKTGFIDNVAQFIQSHALGMAVKKGNIRLAIMAILGRAMLSLNCPFFPVAKIYCAGAQGDLGWIEFVRMRTMRISAAPPVTYNDSRRWSLDSRFGDREVLKLSQIGPVSRVAKILVIIAVRSIANIIDTVLSMTKLGADKVLIGHY